MTNDNGIQLWTVPATATYIIRAVGAGVTYSSMYTTNGMNEFQKGMDATIITTLNKDEVINILVGQSVDTGTSQMGGAGGTFVVRGTQTAIIVAGGGGGRGAQKATISSNATINNNGQNGDVGGSGGSGGSGGNINSYGFGGNAYGAGGGGLIGDGANDSIRGYSGYETGGKSFKNGGAGGDGDLNGGFGGGGGYSGGGADGGGGGGYSGGGGGGHISYVGFTSGGGGGSYSITGSFLSATANNTGPGFVIIQPYIYESMFTSHTFTNAGAMGRSGPTLTNVRDAYSTAAWANTYLNMIGDNGIQLWTVPKTGKYTIDAYGGGTPCGGAGGRIKGDFTLTKNSVLSIVCGQVGTASTWANSGWYAEGGGGGTYVCVGDRIKVNMLCVAGGGGGSTNSESSNLRSNGKYGGWSLSVIGDSDTGGSVLGGNGSGSGGGVSGDGFLQNPQAGTQTAKCFGNASMGGYSTVYSIGVGGFGGGGNGGGNPGGGGGGFRGGDTGIDNIGGQGGTSYILASATNTLNTAGGGGTSQPGKVIITLLTSPATLTFLKTAFYIKYLLNSTISIPLTDISTNNTDTYTLTHSSGSTGGNTGVATVSTSANVGTVTIKGVGKTTITSTIAATANFDEITTTSITITVIGAGLNLTNEVMTSVDLSGTDLAGSVFSGCDLTSANLYGATFNAATDLRGSTLTSLRSGRIIGNTTLLPVGYKII